MTRDLLFGWLVVAGEGLVLLVRRRDGLRSFTLSAAALLLPLEVPLVKPLVERRAGIPVGGRCDRPQSLGLRQPLRARPSQCSRSHVPANG